jgi:hypothetical protein
MKRPPLIRPGAERNLSGWLVRDAVSEISEACTRIGVAISKQTNRREMEERDIEIG